ncbi:prephenate dehydrogenase/arogenate dehydrogenase family protein [Candidatus Falkowbacteria bacterium]|jgi:prephenate dehydrogenase|nr:prephenate dehydrogenase/arogenate dehydrogenase family protein [Candidatus Falkowbacteria bacterium]MBT4433337.1 prephenate dehydrogenase/arogenate dehydrogenase family protein [Candidatus Falkowbacteria bacterium]
MLKQKIAIIGFGRFGSLLAGILSPYGDIFIISKRKINDTRFKQIEYKDLKEIDLIILAVPISSLKKVLKKISPYLKQGSVVMDVCSVKVYPCQWLKKYLPKTVHILGSHPMFGPDSVKKNLEELQIVFCPLRINKEKFDSIKNIFKTIKLKIIEITPEDHDKQNAVSLALVHFIGRGLSKIDVDHQEITTVGFKRLLQLRDNVTNDTEELFKDMHNFNPYAKKIREKYIDSLQKIDLMLD